MAASEARIRANQQNALRSTGPKTVEGKERSRRNSLKHGLTGSGVVTAAEASGEIERVVGTLMAEMAPRSSLGAMLVRQLALFSVRMELGAKQDSASLAFRVRHATEAFDDERIEQAEQLLATLGANPPGHLRKLRRTPEGIDALVEGWARLRSRLSRGEAAAWSDEQFATLANLIGEPPHAFGLRRLEAISRAARGDFADLGELDGSGLDSVARQAWARERLVERIDAEVAALEAHRGTLDYESLELDRIEAPDRALFDASKEAILARRYEAEARRGFYKALEEFRRAEAEFAREAEPQAAEPPNPAPSKPASSPPMASSWDPPDPRPGESFEAYRERAMKTAPPSMRTDRRPSGGARVE